MNIMTKRGSLDNNITYEHFCDTKADMVNINPNYITLGSVCIVINGEDDGMEVYMANSNKEWNAIAMGAGSSEGSISSLVDLLDVSVLNPTDGQTLTYDATAGKWVNGSTSGGDGIWYIDAEISPIPQSTSYLVTTDAQASDVIDAVKANKPVAFRAYTSIDDKYYLNGIYNVSNTYVSTDPYYDEEDPDEDVTFKKIMYISNNIEEHGFFVNNDGIIFN